MFQHATIHVFDPRFTMTDKVPRLIPGVDIRKFKLDPMDGFLLTRIDGKLGPNELARDTGLPDFSVVRALEKLEKLGVIQLVAPGAPAPAPPPAPKPIPPAGTPFDGGLLAPKYDPAELDETAEIPPEHKKRVLDLFYRLEDLDHYTLLGVTREADKKTIKRAYFELAALFHPDRYYKKELGSFKPKMEALFLRITTALDTLTDPTGRMDYDSYLAEVATTRGMEAMFERALAESAQQQPQVIAVEPPPSAPSITVSLAPSVSHPSSSSLVPPSPEEIQRRKEALARRLTGRSRPFQPSQAPAAVAEKANSNPYANPQDAVDALKRRYLERIDGASMAQASRHIQAADDALAKDDLVAAATALNIATKFSPDDLGLAKRAQEVRGNADKVLAESYLKQAQYEEKQAHWPEAARSWQKLAKVRNDARAHERAAHALLQTPEGDLHDASEHAKQAIMLEPTAVANHVTLVEVYLKAGLIASARRAAEAANALDPNHAPLQALLKRFPKA